MWDTNKQERFSTLWERKFSGTLTQSEQGELRSNEREARIGSPHQRIRPVRRENVTAGFRRFGPRAETDRISECYS